MFGRKLFKTKLCTLFQKGRCLRQNCNFAHGDAELRRFGGSFNGETKLAQPCGSKRHLSCNTNIILAGFSGDLRPHAGRREHRISDLRDKLDRRHSPYRRYSPSRDARGHQSFYNKKSASYDKGSSLSSSPTRSERRHKKKRVDGNNEVSEDGRVTEGPEDRKKEKASSTDDKYAFEEQLNQIRLEIETLDDENHQLEIILEDKVGESKKLSNRVDDLESQLNKEQEDCKRVNSRIEKFTKIHGRYIKAQEELKRLQNRLRRLVDHNSSDILKPNVNEENSSEDAFGDREPNSGNKASQRNFELLHNALPTKKRSFGYPTTSEEAKIDSRKRERISEAMHKSEKLIGSEGAAHQSSALSKGTDAIRAIINKYKSPANAFKHKHGKHGSNRVASSDKVKSSETRYSLPSTGMAAHAVDEFNETELDDKTEALGDITVVGGNSIMDNGTKSSYIPPPPPLLNAKDTYKQYEGDDEDVDVEKVDDEMLDINLNSEAEIEQA